MMAYAVAVLRHVEAIWRPGKNKISNKQLNGFAGSAEARVLVPRAAMWSFLQEIMLRPPPNDEVRSGGRSQYGGVMRRDASGSICRIVGFGRGLDPTVH